MDFVARINESLGRHTAWRTGGLCDAFVVVNRREDLARVIHDCRTVDWKWNLLGAGTRTVVRDGGIPGAVIRLGRDFGWMKRVDDERWYVGAGVPMPALVARMSMEGMSGVEDLACVPGSVGASLLLDPGWNVESVEWLSRNKLIFGPHAESREGQKPITGVMLRMRKDKPEAVRKRTERVLQSCGAAGKPPAPSSWYESPKKTSIRLIFASVALPMVRLRGAAIPLGAPELLVNLGGGTCADLALLQRSAMERVKATRGIELESRVIWAGVA